MNKTTFSKWVTTGLLGLGALTLVAGSSLPAQAQGNGYGYGRGHRRAGNGYGNNGYGSNGYGSNGYRNNGNGRARRQPNSSWSEIDRKPNFNTNSRAGFYVWREGDDVYIVSNDPNRTRGSRFTGTVTVEGGTISNTGGYRTEGRDRWQQISSNRLRFNFRTDNGLDGVKFRVNGGHRILINLQEGGTRVDHFYLGQYKVQTVQDPLVIAK